MPERIETAQMDCIDNNRSYLKPENIQNQFVKVYFILCFLSCSLIEFNSGFGQSLSNKIEIPAAQGNEIVVNHSGFALSFNPINKQSNWVAYLLTENRVKTGQQVERSGSFKRDPLVESAQATNNDYKGSGYDKGHLAPAEDMQWGDQTQQESFYYSNASPQSPGLNRGKWKSLENLVRKWAIEYDSLFVVTGPVLNVFIDSIGQGNIPVPGFFYKVILVYTQNRKMGIGFIMQNEKLESELKTFAVPIDAVEKITGLDFFPNLPDAFEIKIENEIGNFYFQ